MLRYHVCMGLDTVSGLLRIMVNGVEVVNEEKDYFRNTTHWKPTSVKGKLVGGNQEHCQIST